MTTTVMKVEMEAEACCICGSTGGDLMTPEEHDAGGSPAQPSLRAMLLHINNAKVVPDGRLCENCIRRTIDAYEFSTMMSARNVPPLSEKIRALRRRLHELTQKIDVFIVVGGPGVGAGGAYSEEDIVAVDRAALAAAANADDEDLERAKNARGEAVYQCTVCPQSFQRVSEFRAHCATHPAESTHSCWTCGAQFASRAALSDHAASHALTSALVCYLCDTTFQTQTELRQHESGCPARCPVCAPERVYPDRSSLSAHVAAEHGVEAQGTCVCPACFRQYDSGALLSAHMLRHRQAKQFVCGYDGCILRFATRNNLMAHIRKCHSGEAPEEERQQTGNEPAVEPPSTTCHCGRTFGSVAALKRHSRVHRSDRQDATATRYTEVDGNEYSDMEAMEGQVEYLEVEALDALEALPGDEAEYDEKPILSI